MVYRFPIGHDTSWKLVQSAQVCGCVCSINVVPELPKLPATLPGPRHVGPVGPVSPFELEG